MANQLKLPRIIDTLGGHYSPNEESKTHRIQSVPPFRLPSINNVDRILHLESFAELSHTSDSFVHIQPPMSKILVPENVRLMYTHMQSAAQNNNNKLNFKYGNNPQPQETQQPVSNVPHITEIQSSESTTAVSPASTSTEDKSNLLTIPKNAKVGKDSKNTNSPKQSPKGKQEKKQRESNFLWCHQCKQKHTNVIFCTVCTSKKYCFRCIWRHYQEKIKQIDTTKWKCYYCRGTCNCASCRRRLAKETNGKYVSLRGKKQPVLPPPSPDEMVYSSDHENSDHHHHHENPPPHEINTQQNEEQTDSETESDEPLAIAKVKKQNTVKILLRSPGKDGYVYSWTDSERYLSLFDDNKLKILIKNTPTAQEPPKQIEIKNETENPTNEITKIPEPFVPKIQIPKNSKKRKREEVEPNQIYNKLQKLSPEGLQQVNDLIEALFNQQK